MTPAQEYWSHAQPWILASLILGLALKTPLVPFHAWFTAAVAEAPLCAGLALLGAGLHLSTYAFIRIVGPFGGEWGAGGGLVIVLAVLGAVHQSLLALSHDDVRKMTACAACHKPRWPSQDFSRCSSWGPRILGRGRARIGAFAIRIRLPGDTF